MEWGVLSPVLQQQCETVCMMPFTTCSWIAPLPFVVNMRPAPPALAWRRLGLVGAGTGRSVGHRPAGGDRALSTGAGGLAADVRVRMPPSCWGALAPRRRGTWVERRHDGSSKLLGGGGVLLCVPLGSARAFGRYGVSARSAVRFVGGCGAAFFLGYAAPAILATQVRASHPRPATPPPPVLLWLKRQAVRACSCLTLVSAVGAGGPGVRRHPAPGQAFAGAPCGRLARASEHRRQGGGAAGVSNDRRRARGRALLDYAAACACRHGLAVARLPHL